MNATIPLVGIEHTHVTNENGEEIDSKKDDTKLCGWFIRTDNMDDFIKEYGEDGLKDIIQSLENLKKELKQNYCTTRTQALEI